MKKITVEEAARELGTSTKFLRKCLRDGGRYPFGQATIMPGSSRWTYTINESLFRMYLAGKFTQPVVPHRKEEEPWKKLSSSLKNL